MSITTSGIGFRAFVADQLLVRNERSRRFFDREADRLAGVCEQMSHRFLRGGRLLAFGRHAAATDAQHVSVEFVHPVIVGKRALPALDLSAAFEMWVPAIAREIDIVMGFGTGAAAPVADTLDHAEAIGALTLALPGSHGAFAIGDPDPDPFVAQEIVEILYHTLWETVHVFFEHREGRDDDLGASAFLYPFLGSRPQDTSGVAGDVAASIRAKAADDERIRTEVAETQADGIAEAVAAVRRQVSRGGTLLLFGNGGSATDANDWAIDCVSAPGDQAIPAMSLAMEAANLTAIANDIGREAMFVRQLIAQGRAGDVAVAISTSGGSPNVIAALEEARQRGMLTLALLGSDGGEVVRRGLADIPIVVPCDYIPRIQEVQASIYHVMTEACRR
jgi:D-sedoheptulose 7-phosphate isomerase